MVFRDDRRSTLADPLDSDRRRRGFGHGTARGPRLAAALIAGFVVLVVFLRRGLLGVCRFAQAAPAHHRVGDARREQPDRDRKSTRLNSSHEWISYAVFCLKKKKKQRVLALH